MDHLMLRAKVEAAGNKRQVLPEVTANTVPKGPDHLDTELRVMVELELALKLQLTIQSVRRHLGHKKLTKSINVGNLPMKVNNARLLLRNGLRSVAAAARRTNRRRVRLRLRPRLPRGRFGATKPKRGNENAKWKRK